MSKPVPRRSALAGMSAVHPDGFEAPRNSVAHQIESAGVKAGKSRQKLTVVIDAAVVDRARGLWAARLARDPMSWARFVEQALEAYVESLDSGEGVAPIPPGVVPRGPMPRI